MEGVTFGRASAGRGLWLVLAFVLAIRIPFWNQPVQGDDSAYLHEAAHAQMDWLHPVHTLVKMFLVDIEERGTVLANDDEINPGDQSPAEYRETSSRV